jgi:hypothetical protein
MTKYTAHYQGEIVGTRTSYRSYTHAVVVQDDEEAHRAYAYGYELTASDRKNFEYYESIAQRQPGDPHRTFGSYSAEQITDAKAKIAGGLAGYAEAQRQQQIVWFEAKRKKGGFKPRVATWCGRRDLADKAARSFNHVGKRSSGFTHLRAVVPAELVTKVPSGSTSP